ncbi:MAG TPA: cell envelope integrity protein TolA [Caldimonas sp.]|jgi:colicin import membrane protein|nr:cell envelope integrity protein TolA [Caldimonas sp.]HEX2541980.1 cell envelope integrity protein TolA [Caldimonas sp.]
MNTAAMERDAFAPRRPDGMGRGLVLALIAHALLIVALAVGVNWRASEPEGVVAELWSPTPQVAAPRSAAPEPPPPKPEPPVPKPQLPPPPPRPAAVEPARPDPQIAIERAARERQAREEARKQEIARERERERLAEEREREKKRLLAEKQQAEKREQAEKAEKAEQARKEEARLAAIREANLRKMMAQAGTSDDPLATGAAARTAGPSAGYAGRIKARIKPNIVLTGDVNGNPLAVVEVRLAPDGTIVSRKLARSSGSAVWDETVLRAIDKTEVLPKDVDGRVPSSMAIEFKPQE